MGLFDILLKEVTSKFDIGNKAMPLLTALLSLIADENAGGLSGLVSKFTRAGMGDLINSWVSRGDNKTISVDQLESALGANTLNDVAQKAGLSGTIAKSALAFMLPKIIDLLTPNGSIPSSLPNEVMSLIGAPRRAAAATVEKSGGSIWRWLLPLLALGALAFFGFNYCNKPTVNNTTVATVTPSPTIIPNINSTLSLINDNGKINISGVVPDDKTRQSILDQIKSVFGAANVLGDLKVDPHAKPAEWLAKLGEFLPNFKVPGAEVMFDGTTIKLGGSMAEAAKNSLLEKIKSIFGATFSFSLFDRVKDAVNAATQKTMEALASLKAGFTGDDLVKALNLSIINFASGSAQIPAESNDLIKKAADVFKQAPQNTVVEIGGHTDNTGNAAGNVKLSQARAESVRNALVKLGVNAAMLKAKGYGGDKPAGDNTTAEGRFQNRRIEYTLTK